MLLCMLHMFYMLLVSNIFMLQALNTTYQLICGYVQYAFYFLLHLFRSHLCCFNKILQFYSQGSHADFVFLYYHKQNKYFSTELLFLWNSIQCSPDPLCPPSFASTWLKPVMPSVLAGRWHVSLVFLTQISVSIQITYSFLTL